MFGGRLTLVSLVCGGLGIFVFGPSADSWSHEPATQGWVDPLVEERARAAQDPAHRPHLLGDGEGANLGDARVDRAGAHVAAARGAVSVALAALGRAGVPIPIGDAAPEVIGPEVRIRRAPGVVEWWRSLAVGLEQGVDIARRPRGTGALHLDMTVGAHVTPKVVDEDTIALVAPDGAPLARYAHLTIMEARGARVPGEMTVHEGRIRLIVDDRHATYPLVVDPLLDLGGADFVAVAGANNVALSPDGNGAIVGVPGSNSARTYRYSSGSDSWTLIHALGGLPDAVAYGSPIAMAANASHVVVADPAWSSGRGRVQYYKNDGGTYRGDVLTAPGVDANSGFGSSVAITDGATRVFVGAPRDVQGTPSGTVRSFDCDNRLTAGACTHRQTITPNASSASGSEFGTSVGIDRDASLLVVGAPAYGGEGMVEVYVRSGSSFSHLQTLRAPARQAGERFGTRVATNGEWLVVGADRYTSGGDTQRGRVVAYRRPGGTGRFGAGTTIAVGPGVGAQLGSSVAISDNLSGSGTGTRAIAGAIEEGYVAVYELDGSVWGPGGSETLGSSSRLGSAVSIARNGRRALAAAPGRSRARIYTVRRRQGASCGAGTDCGTSHCVDGVCCDTACVGLGADAVCNVCSRAAGGDADGVCGPPRDATVCREAAGMCDQPETCVGTRCPDDAFLPGVECRPKDGTLPCDAAEVCVDGNPDCPDDVPERAGEPCRDAVDPNCDIEDFCDGESFECEDRVVEAGTICRSAGGPCDADDLCDGAGACVENVQPEGTVCNAAVLDVCDTPDVCNGLTVDCPATYLADVECRPAAGTCDAPEFCSGDSPSCPPDAVEAAGMVCRESSAACDPSERCDGASGSCPADVNACEPSDGGTDAEVPDGGFADAGAPVAATGCGCRAVRASDAPFAFLLLALTCLRRRRSD